jgi:hypothetical protein
VEIIDVEQCFSNCGSRRPAGGFGRKRIVKIVSDTERMKNTPILVCAKLPLLVDLQQHVGELLLSISSCPSIIILENILISVYKKCGYGNFDPGIMLFPFTCMHFWVCRILRRWSTCAPTAYEVLRDYRKFEKHCFRAVGFQTCTGLGPH